MLNERIYTIHCFCGAVTYRLKGTPELMAYCHCQSCRQWGATSTSAFTLWSPEALKVTQGQEKLASFDKNSAKNKGEVLSERTWCQRCGSHVFTKHPKMGLIDVPSPLIPDLEFIPAFHVHYQEHVMPFKDGLPKYSDLPEPAGGSGKLMNE